MSSLESACLVRLSVYLSVRLSAKYWLIRVMNSTYNFPATVFKL